MNRLLARSSISTSINTALVERRNLTQRLRNSRKVRRTLRFSKSGSMHEAMSFFSHYSDNFCWCVRTLRRRDRKRESYTLRTPAMAAGLTDHAWNLTEWLTHVVAGLAG